jgi:hypothetical protein
MKPVCVVVGTEKLKFGDEWWTVHDDWLLIRWLNAPAGGVTGGDGCIPFEAVVVGAPAGVSLDPCGDGTLVVCGGCFRLAGLARRDQQQFPSHS